MAAGQRELVPAAAQPDRQLSCGWQYSSRDPPLLCCGLQIVLSTHIAILSHFTRPV